VNARSGRLPGAGVIVGVLTPLMVVGAAALTGGGIFSPGPLRGHSTGAAGQATQIHADLACSDCHAPFWGAQTMADRCLSCHEDVQAELAVPNSLHGKLPNPGACRDCHTEHHGMLASLTRVDEATFPHYAFGFALTVHLTLRDGKAFACENCHETGLMHFQGQTCSQCHLKMDGAAFMPHEIAFGSSCLNCHDGLDSYGADFNHAETGFPLVAAHELLKCDDCHVGARTLEDLHATSPTCVSCHQMDDPHQGALGDDCAACHTATQWTDVSFDHAVVGFKLTGAHASVDCSACHVNGTGTPVPTTCAGCHAQDDAHDGRLGQECEACHATSAWKDVHFDHRQTGFLLTGSHLEVACSQCHVNGETAPVPSTCVGCHKADDAHQGRLGTDCAACHVTTTWSKVDLSGFNHSLTGFKLIGSHQNLACESCHTNGHWSGLFQSCAACHKADDAHSGQFGTDCSLCHNPTRWSDASFDHGKVTGFALMGSHQSLSCQSCHTNGQFSGLSQTCASCHKADDAHNGQFGTDCRLCHNPTRWSDASFDHGKVTGFALMGSHQSLACQSCHANGQFSGLSQSCASCHKADDAHNGQFGTDCRLCHNPTRWSDASFDHGKATGFALVGSHQSLACHSCHTNGQWSGLSQTCYSCHKADDAHNGQFGTDCRQCHNPTRWSDASFDHGKVTGFALMDSHSGLSCNACHTNGGYSGLSSTCISCHKADDAHNGAFGTDCAACHRPTKWSNASFDHSQTGFKLTGAHTNLACESCHAGGKYQGTPKDCVACHSEPSYHQGLFGTDCAKCHSTSAWQPATFDQSHSFPLNHGHAGGDCQKCHPSELASYTCYKCHNKSETEKHHAEKGITDLSNCVACHPNGKGD